jgi:hypothetical protein
VVNDVLTLVLNDFDEIGCLGRRPRHPKLGRLKEPFFEWRISFRTKHHHRQFGQLLTLADISDPATRRAVFWGAAAWLSDFTDSLPCELRPKNGTRTPRGVRLAALADQLGITARNWLLAQLETWPQHYVRMWWGSLR